MGLCGSSTSANDGATNTANASNATPQAVDLSNVDISKLTDAEIEAIELGFFKKLKAVDTTRDVSPFEYSMRSR